MRVKDVGAPRVKSKKTRELSWEAKRAKIDAGRERVESKLAWNVGVLQEVIEVVRDSEALHSQVRERKLKLLEAALYAVRRARG